MKNKKIFYFSGTHWDREWYQTYQGFRINLVNTLNKMIDYFENHDDIGVFHLDGQTIVLEDYCEIEPENALRLKKLIENKRILIGPWYTMPDEFIVSGESLIRNLQLGHKLSREWGTSAWKNGYNCDIFGHIAQMPQIFNNFNINTCVLGRGTLEKECSNFFTWESPDGSQLLTYKVPENCGYGAFAMEVVGQIRKNREIEANSTFESLAKNFIDREIARSSIPITIIMDAMDHEPLHEKTGQYIKKIQELYPDYEIVNVDLLNAFKELEPYSKTLYVKKGELNKTAQQPCPHHHLITNTLSSRYSIKKRNETCEKQLLLGLEPITPFLLKHAHFDTRKYLSIAWKWLLQNHAHDSICGCSVDRVHDEMGFRFSQVESIYESIFDETERILSNGYKIISSCGSYINIFNPLPLSYKKLITLSLSFDKKYPKWHEPFNYEDINAFRLFDENNNEIEYAITNIQNNCIARTISESVVPVDIYEIKAEISLKANNITSLKIVPSEKPVRFLGSMIDDMGNLENDLIKVTINNDARISITDKINNVNYDNLLGIIDDSEIGDGWFSARNALDKKIINKNLKSIETITNSKNYAQIKVGIQLDIPKSIIKKTTQTARAEDYKTLEIDLYISISKSSSEVKVKMIVNNNVTDHRLKITFPIKGEDYFVNQAFAFIERKCGIDESTHDWKELDSIEKSMQGIVGKRNSENKGLAFISNYGLKECAAGNDMIAVTLFRCTSKTHTTNGEPNGQEQGKKVYEFSILPLDNSVTNSNLQKIQNINCVENRSFISDAITNYDSICEINGANFSSLYLSQDNNLILRVNNLEKNESLCTIKVNSDYSCAKLCNMLEESYGENLLENNCIKIKIAPNKIISLKIN